MSTTLSTSIQLLVKASLTDDLGTLQPLLQALGTLDNGTTVGLSDLVYAKSRTISSSGSPDTIDLSGSLLMPNQAACVFVEITGIFIKNLDAAATLTVGNGSNPFINWVGSGAHTVKVGPLGSLWLYNPADPAYAVTAATGDILQVACSTGSNVAYAIILVGRSA